MYICIWFNVYIISHTSDIDSNPDRESLDLNKNLFDDDNDDSMRNVFTSKKKVLSNQILDPVEFKFVHWQIKIALVFIFKFIERCSLTCLIPGSLFIPQGSVGY